MRTCTCNEFIRNCLSDIDDKSFAGRKIVKCPDLTPREKEVLELMSFGKSNIEIAKELVISEHTAKAHVCHILAKFGVHDRLLAVATAIRSKIIE